MPRPLHGPKPSTSRVKLSVHRPATVTNGWCVVLLLSFRSSVFRWRAKCTQLLPFRAKGCASPHTPRADQRVLELGLSAAKRARAPNDTFWDDRSRDISNATLFGTDSPCLWSNRALKAGGPAGVRRHRVLTIHAGSYNNLVWSKLQQVAVHAPNSVFTFPAFRRAVNTLLVRTLEHKCVQSRSDTRQDRALFARGEHRQVSCIARRFRVELSFDSRSPIKTVEICNLLHMLTILYFQELAGCCFCFFQPQAVSLAARDSRGRTRTTQRA